MPAVQCHTTQIAFSKPPTFRGKQHTFHHTNKSCLSQGGAVTFQRGVEQVHNHGCSSMYIAPRTKRLLDRPAITSCATRRPMPKSRETVFSSLFTAQLFGSVRSISSACMAVSHTLETPLVQGNNIRLLFSYVRAVRRSVSFVFFPPLLIFFCLSCFLCGVVACRILYLEHVCDLLASC